MFPRAVRLDSLSQVFPAFREEEVDKPFKDECFGKVNRVWLNLGLLVVLTNDGQRLYGLDTRPVTSLQVSSYWSEIVHLEVPIIDVLFSPASARALYVIKKNGDVEHRVLDENYMWKLAGKFKLSDEADVISACLHPVWQAIYWCQSDNNGCQVCEIQIPDGCHSFGSKSKPVVLFENCPPCQVYALTRGFLIVPRDVDSESVLIGLVWIPFPNSVTLLIGTSKVPVTDHHRANEPLDVRLLLLKFQGLIYETRNNTTPVIGRAYHLGSQSYVILHEDGLLQTWSTNLDKHETTSRIPRDSITGIHSWMNLHDCIVGIGEKIIRLYQKSCGQKIGEISTPDSQVVQGCFAVHGGLDAAGIFTMGGIFLIQKRFVNTDKLPTGKVYQTEALDLVSFDLERRQTPGVEVQKKLEALRIKWNGKTQTRPLSAYSVVTGPFTESYWTLEDKWHDIINKKESLGIVDSGSSVEEIVNHLVNDAVKLPLDARQIQLLILAEQYPQQVLHALLKQVDLSTDAGDEDLHMWWSILGLEQHEMKGTGVGLVLFETFCYLLFLEIPEKLVPFLNKVQEACRQSIGVVAFTRQRESNKVYEQALSCLPTPDRSQDPFEAVETTVELLARSNLPHCVFKGQHLLLMHKHWDSAVLKLQNYTEDSGLFPQLLHITVNTMKQENVLHQHAGKLLHLVSSTSNISLPVVLRELKGLDRAQAALYVGPPDFPYHAVQASVCELQTSTSSVQNSVSSCPSKCSS